MPATAGIGRKVPRRWCFRVTRPHCCRWDVSSDVLPCPTTLPWQTSRQTSVSSPTCAGLLRAASVDLGTSCQWLSRRNSHLVPGLAQASLCDYSAISGAAFVGLLSGLSTVGASRYICRRRTPLRATTQAVSADARIPTQNLGHDHSSGGRWQSSAPARGGRGWTPTDDWGGGERKAYQGEVRHRVMPPTEAGARGGLGRIFGYFTVR